MHKVGQCLQLLAKVSRRSALLWKDLGILTTDNAFSGASAIWDYLIFYNYGYGRSNKCCLRNYSDTEKSHGKPKMNLHITLEKNLTCKNTEGKTYCGLLLVSFPVVTQLTFPTQYTTYANFLKYTPSSILKLGLQYN